MSTLPVDRKRPFVARDYPHDPSEYVPLDHFIQRYKEPERFLSDEVIERTLSEGDLRDNGDGTACFRKEWGKGVAYYFIAGFHYKGYRVLITAWPHLHNRDAALDSGEWSSEELDTIERLNEKKSDSEQSLTDDYPDYVSWSKQHPNGGTQPA